MLTIGNLVNTVYFNFNFDNVNFKSRGIMPDLLHFLSARTALLRTRSRFQHVLYIFCCVAPHTAIEICIHRDTVLGEQ